MSGIESSNDSKREELYDSLLSSIERIGEEERRNKPQWIFLTVHPREEEEKDCSEITERETWEVTEPAWECPLRMIIWRPAWRKWLLENWHRVTMEAKRAFLWLAKEHGEYQFLYALKTRKASQEIDIEKLLEEIEQEDS